VTDRLGRLFFSPRKPHAATSARLRPAILRGAHTADRARGTRRDALRRALRLLPGAPVLVALACGLAGVAYLVVRPRRSTPLSRAEPERDRHAVCVSRRSALPRARCLRMAGCSTLSEPGSALGPVSGGSRSARSVRGTPLNSRATTSAAGARRSTRRGWSTHLRARRA
jgi:hypothetical protein